MQLVPLVKSIVGVLCLLWAAKPIHEAERRAAHEHRFPGMPFNPWTKELAHKTFEHTIPGQALLASHFLSKRLMAPPVDEIQGYSQGEFLDHLLLSWDNSKYDPDAPAQEEAAPIVEEEEPQKEELADAAGKRLREAGEKLWKLCGGIEDGKVEPLPVPVAKCLLKGALALYAYKPILDAERAMHHEHKYPGMPFNPWTPALARKVAKRALPEIALLTGEALYKKYHVPTRFPAVSMPPPRGPAAVVAAPAPEELKGLAAEDELEVAEAVAVAEGVKAPVEATNWAVYDYLVWLATGLALGGAGGWLTAHGNPNRAASDAPQGEIEAGLPSAAKSGEGASAKRVFDQEEQDSSSGEEGQNCWPQLRRNKTGA